MQVAAFRTLLARTPFKLAFRSPVPRCYSTKSPAPPAQSGFLDYVSDFRQNYKETHPVLVVSQLELVPLDVARPNGMEQQPYGPELPLVPLPELPLRPKYPSPWLEDSDYETYLKPLYSRMWRVMRHSPLGTSPGSFRERQLYLGKHMVFATSSGAEEYTNALTILMEKAVHHGHVRHVANNVFYATNTHSAVAVDPEKEIPGITHHDIRLALKAEKMWEEHFVSGKAVLPPASVRPPGALVKSIRSYGLSVRTSRSGKRQKWQSKHLRPKDDKAKSPEAEDARNQMTSSSL